MASAAAQMIVALCVTGAQLGHLLLWAPMHQVTPDYVAELLALACDVATFGARGGAASGPAPRPPLDMSRYGEKEACQGQQGVSRPAGHLLDSLRHRKSLWAVFSQTTTAA